MIEYAATIPCANPVCNWRACFLSRSDYWRAVRESENQTLVCAVCRTPMTHAAPFPAFGGATAQHAIIRLRFAQSTA